MDREQEKRKNFEKKTLGGSRMAPNLPFQNISKHKQKLFNQTYIFIRTSNHRTRPTIIQNKNERGKDLGQ